MRPRWRADLNKYRGWLLHQILKQVIETDYEREANQPLTQRPYYLPEDLPKIVDDLYLFHKHITGKDANIARHSLKDLNALTEPYRPKYPISPAERIEAHARFLMTGTDEDLQNRLPSGWTVSATHVETPDHRMFERKEGAKLIATLDDGTEVIQLLTEEASRAYGSPRWCTAYRERDTYFEQYKDNLLVVLADDGQRWQIHIASGQWMDASDHQIDQKEFLRSRLGLATALLPVLITIRQGPEKARRSEAYSDALTTIVHCVSPEINNKSPQNLIDALNNLAKLAHPQSDYAIEDIFRASKKKPLWKYVTGANLGSLLHTAAKHGGGRAFSIILSFAEDVPEWKTETAKQLGAILSDQASQEGGGADVELILERARWVPEWKKAITQILPTALRNSLDAKGDHSLLKILRSAREEPDWCHVIKRHLGSSWLTLIRNGDRKLWNFMWDAIHTPELKDEMLRYRNLAENLAREKGFTETIDLIARAMHVEKEPEPSYRHPAARQSNRASMRPH
ncbi:MAG: hypothetical protein PHY92_07635 [Alphaproteobacteria bacterium]|nr:hypothetical protein [Alphaproteobacteria bacterium]